MKTYYAQISISVSDDVDPMDVFDYVEDAVRSWGELRLIDEASNYIQSCHSEPVVGPTVKASTARIGCGI